MNKNLSIAQGFTGVTNQEDINKLGNDARIGGSLPEFDLFVMPYFGTTTFKDRNTDKETTAKMMIVGYENGEEVFFQSVFKGSFTRNGKSGTDVEKKGEDGVKDLTDAKTDLFVILGQNEKNLFFQLSTLDLLTKFNNVKLKLVDNQPFNVPTFVDGSPDWTNPKTVNYSMFEINQTAKDEKEYKKILKAFLDIANTDKKEWINGIDLVQKEIEKRTKK